MHANDSLHRFAVLVAAATLLLIFAGGLVTSTGSGLSVPDWPLSFGRLFPEMTGGVAYEHGHRMVAALVGLLTLILALWLWKREPRRWVRMLGAVAVGAVIAQALLGGATVLLRLPLVLSVGHAALAQVFLCLTIAIAVATSGAWRERNAVADAGDHSVIVVAVLTTIAVFVQILLGAMVRHTGGGLAIPDFPLSYGRLVPPYFTTQVLFNYVHRVGAIVVLLLGIWLAVKAVRLPRSAGIRFPARLLTGLLVLQILLGGATVWSRKEPLLTTFHVACGAIVLAISLWLAMSAFRARGWTPARSQVEVPAA